MDRVGPIGVLGATGFTGGRVVEALERLGRPYVVIGRRVHALENAAGPECVGERVADVTDACSLVMAFEGLAAVVNAVGPFAVHGEAVARAAIDAGVHLTDISAEITWLEQVGDLHKAADLAGVCIIPGNGCDFGFAWLAAALADEAVQGARELHFHQWMADFVPSGGTLESILRQSKARPMALSDGRLIRHRGLGLHRKLIQDLEGWGVPWAGGEPVLLPLDYPAVRDIDCHLVLSLPESLGFALGTRVMARLPQRVLGLGARLATRLPDPSDELRQRARFRLICEAVNGEQIARVRIDAPDIYGITGDLAAVTACMLADGEARECGVHTTGAALSPTDVLRALEPRGVELTMPPEPLRRHD